MLGMDESDDKSAAVEEKDANGGKYPGGERHFELG